MEAVSRNIVGTIAAALSIFAPIQSLVVCAVIFISIDFIIGVYASYKRARRSGEYWAFESSRAWETVTKLSFVMAGIVMAWMIESHILPFMNLKLANIFTGFVCGVEFWSYLENAAEISQHPIFRALKKVMKQRMDRAMDIEDRDNEES